MPHAAGHAFLAVRKRVWFERRSESWIPSAAIMAQNVVAASIRETKRVMKTFLAGLCLAALSLAATGAYAAQPEPWQLGFQPAATALMEEVAWFEHYTLWFIGPITLLVMALLAWCMFRFHESRNPAPSRASHNTLIEVIWTVGPVIVLLFLAVPSFQLLTSQYTMADEPEVTIKATGVQWYWDYEYQFDEPLSFTSLLLGDDEREEAGKEDLSAYPRLLAVDNEVVVPVDTTVRLLVTASDVIHSFAMPAFGLKVDAVPGRVQESWFKADKEGLYYGQCSELCGKDHAYMPIAVRVVAEDQYEDWLETASSDLDEANQQLMAAVEGEKEVATAGE